jgi:hypothetical protein
VLTMWYQKYYDKAIYWSSEYQSQH